MKPGAAYNLLPLGFLVFVSILHPVYAQVILEPFMPSPGKVVITERSDFSRYENGRYVGHTYREARLALDVAVFADRSIRYDGEALVLEETLRDERMTARRMDDSMGVSFFVLPDGTTSFKTDNGYPILRGFPDPPAKSIPQGSTWIDEAVIVVKPRQDAQPTRIPVLVEYEFIGTTKYAELDALAIRARYAVRYKGNDPSGDKSMTGSSGSRVADIVIARDGGETLFIRETVDETFTFSGGSTVRLKGFILHFHRGSVSGDRDRIAAIVSTQGAPGYTPAVASMPPAATASGAGSAAADLPAAPAAATKPAQGPGFEVVQGDRGVVLLLYDLRFVADGDELLPAERNRLDAIAEALKRISERTFLVEGHTADLGKPAGQYELSERRAKRIVDELTARGIAAGRFIYRGLGADKPIAPNDTESNRARNRRVEITILD